MKSLVVKNVTTKNNFNDWGIVVINIQIDSFNLSFGKMMTYCLIVNFSYYIAYMHILHILSVSVIIMKT